MREIWATLVSITTQSCGRRRACYCCITTFSFKKKLKKKKRFTYLFAGCGGSWRRQWHPTPVLLPGKSHGRRSLVGCSPLDREESDMTERLDFHFSISCIGEWNGNPLQCSCMENPRDGGAWWAAVYGVAQSRTRLKRLSSSSSSCGGSVACEGFLSLQRAGAALPCGVWVSHGSGFSCCGTQALGIWASVVAGHGLSSCASPALEHCLSAGGAQA